MAAVAQTTPLEQNPLARLGLDHCPDLFLSDFLVGVHQL